MPDSVTPRTRRRLAAGLIALAPLVCVMDAVRPEGAHPLLLVGPLDELGHLATGILLVAAIGIRDRRFVGPELAASVLIDLDHIPGALGDHWLTGGTPRPYPHSLLTLAVVAVFALAPRLRVPVAGVLVGLAGHLARDLGEGSGVALLWPFSSQGFSVAPPVYDTALVLIGAIAAWRLVSRGAAGDRPQGDQHHGGQQQPEHEPMVRGASEGGLLVGDGRPRAGV